MWFGVWGLGLWGLGFEGLMYVPWWSYSLGRNVSSLEFRVLGLGFGVGVISLGQA